MSLWRLLLGRWLLRPLLRRELQLAARYHENAEGPLERYWMGRLTAVDRIDRQLRSTVRQHEEHP